MSSSIKQINIKPILLHSRTRKTRAKTPSNEPLSSAPPRIRVKTSKANRHSSSPPTSLESMLIKKKNASADAPASDEFSAAVQFLNDMSKKKTQTRLGVRAPNYTRSNTNINSDVSRQSLLPKPIFKMPTILPPASVAHVEQVIQPSPSQSFVKRATLAPAPVPAPVPASVPMPIEPSAIIAKTALTHVAPGYTVDADIPYSSLVNGIKPSYRSYTQRARPAARVQVPKNDKSLISKSNIKRTRKTVRHKYHIGKSLKNRKVSVLVKNASTQKRNREAQQSLQAVSMTDIRTHLCAHNLIRADSAAPDHILKQIFESAMLAGDISNNINSGMSKYNALTEFDIIH